MTPDMKAPERIWPYEWHRYAKKNRGGGQIEYVRADLLTATQARAQAAEAERDTLRAALDEAEARADRAATIANGALDPTNREVVLRAELARVRDILRGRHDG